MTATYFRLRDGALRQDWSATGLVAGNDDWSGVPSIEGFLGEDLVAATGADPRGILGSGATRDVIANQASPGTLNSGGVAEFEGANPTIALNGSGSADAPYLVLHLDTTAVADIVFSFNARDLDGSADNAVQPLAVQYRLGGTGDWLNLDGGFLADATGGPGEATLSTAVRVTLPPAAENQPEVQLRVLTANAVGNDEWVGIDDIVVTTGTAPPAAGATVSVTPLDADRAEGDAGTTAFTFEVTRSNGDAAGSVQYVVTGITADAADFGGALPAGEVLFAIGETRATVTLNVAGDTLAEADESFGVTLRQPSGDMAIGTGTASGIIRSDDIALERISNVQGSGAGSAFVGRSVVVEAIVVGDFQTGDADAGRNLAGFYLQEEAADGDGDAATSEGLFISLSALPADVALGDRVRVTGVVEEYFGQTQLRASAVVLLQADAVADIGSMAAALALPGVGVTLAQDGGYQADLEAYEGMLVRLPQTLVVTEQFNLDRFNEIVLAAGERPVQYTQTHAPDAAGYDAHLRGIAARSIVYDDGLNTQNNPVGGLDGFGGYATGTAPRMGDTVTGLTGVLDYQWAGNAGSGATWRVRGVEDGANSFTRATARTPAPEDVGGTLKVGSLNVLNFFATLDADGHTIANGQAPRGANSAPEFERQAEKLVNAIVALDADVLGLLELENDFRPGSPGNAIELLVARLNQKAGADAWAWVDPGVDAVGGDAIGVGFLYRQDTVRLAAGSSVAILDDSDIGAGLLAQSTVGGIFNGANTSRAALAATFQEIATGESFTASVDHFKSKGGTGTGSDADALDGAGSWNHQRLLAAQALEAWLDGNPTGAADPDRIILGDLNAYAREAPVQYLVGQGYENLQDTRIKGAYSYVFDGQTGSLDQVLTSASLSAQVTGVTEWHINSDEADALDYNLDFGRDPAYFDGRAPIRVSDHDPLLVGLALRAETPDTQAPALQPGALLLGSASPLAVLTPALLGVADNITPLAALAFTVSTDATVGALLLGGRDLERGGSFSGADLAAGRVTYLAGASAAAADGFGLTVADAAGLTTTASITVALPGFDTVQAAPQNGGYWGGAGRDFLRGSIAAEEMAGGAGDDVIVASAGADSLYAGAGNDRVQGGGGRDFIAGLAGDDWLEGGSGTDSLYGGDGDDVLNGGTGNNDLLNGGVGRDTILFRQGDGRDIAEAFASGGEDRIDLRHFSGVLGGADSWAELQQAGMARQEGSDTVLRLTDDDWLTLRAVSIAQLVEGDFIFA